MLKLKIVTPEKVVYDGNADNVTVPGTLGSFEILTDHAPIVSSLESGNVKYSLSGKSQEISILGGFVEVRRNEVDVCVEI
jgi:F-type H+-transporting ATPase subunit epsilon